MSVARPTGGRLARAQRRADCRLYGRMVQPSGRRVDLKTKTGDIKDLNANFVKHLEKRDKADRTSHADTWRKGLIHGPQAPFTVPYDDQCTDGDGGGEDGAMDTSRARRRLARHPPCGRTHGRDGGGKSACRRKGARSSRRDRTNSCDHHATPRQPVP